MQVFGIVGGAARVNWSARNVPPVESRLIHCWTCWQTLDGPYTDFLRETYWLERGLLATALVANQHRATCTTADVRFTSLRALEPGFALGPDAMIPVLDPECVAARYEERDRAREAARLKGPLGYRTLWHYSGHHAPRRLLRWTKQLVPVAIRPPERLEGRFLEALRAHPSEPRTPRQFEAVRRKYEGYRKRAAMIDSLDRAIKARGLRTPESQAAP